MGKRCDYATWLLKALESVDATDARHALVKYIVPLFDKDANLAGQFFNEVGV